MANEVNTLLGVGNLLYPSGGKEKETHLSREKKTRKEGEREVRIWEKRNPSK